MLEKYFKKIQTALEKEVTMEQETTQTNELSAELTAQLEAATAQLAEQATAFAAAQTQVTELSAQLGDALAKLAAADEAKAKLEATAKEDKLVARKQAIIAAIGEAQAEAVMAATEGLDDASFTAVAAAMQSARDVESKSPLFTETGISDEAPAPAGEQDPVAKLAAGLKAQFNPE